MKTFLYRFLPWLLALGLLWWVLRAVEVAAVWGVLQRLRLDELVGLALANGVVLLTLNGRWWLTLYGQGHKLPFWRLLGYRLAAFGLSYVTPGPHFGGEPLQVYFVEKGEGVARETAVAAVTLDKLLELFINFTFLLLGVIVIIQWRAAPGLLGQRAVWAAGVLFAVPLGMLMALWGGKRPLTSLLHGSKALWQRLGGSESYGRLLAVVERSEQQMTRFCRQTPGLLLAALLLSLVSWLAMLAEYWLMVSFLGTTLTLLQLVVTLTAARIAILLLIPGAVGALEASQLLAFQAVGLDPAVGISASLLIRARDVVLAALGLWWGVRQLRRLSGTAVWHRFRLGRK